MSPSVTAAVNAVAKADNDDKKEPDNVVNSQSLSNESMSSLMMEGLVSPVEEEDNINDNQVEDVASNGRPLDLDNDHANSAMELPSVPSSSSDWDIERRGDSVDSFSPPSAAPLATRRIKSQWSRMNENTNDDESSVSDSVASFRSSKINYDACITPPTRPYTPTTGYDTPLSYYRAGRDDKSWLDPFPTPDISLRGGQHCHNTSNNVHTSRQGRIIVYNSGTSNNATKTSQSNEEWGEIKKVLPKLPTYDDMKTHDEISFKKELTNLSCPDLDTLGNDKVSFRHVSSEACLLPIIKRNSSVNKPPKRPSMEAFWSALRTGPDGNGLDLETNRQKGAWDESILRRNSSGVYYRRDLNRYELVDRDRNKSIIKDGQSIPVDNTSGEFHEWEGIRRRNTTNPNTSLQHGRTTSVDQVGSNAVTLNIVTGAGLAKEVKLLRERGTMTPGRIRSFLASPTVTRVRTSAQQRVIRPVQSAIVKRRTSAARLVRSTRQKLAERKERRRQCRITILREPAQSWWIVIPADHPYKVAWDVLTMLWSLLGAYRTHIRIRDRVFDQSPLIMLTEIWFTLDIMLNFVTEHKTRNGEVIKDGKTVWARYLTTWFLIDVLSLIPWERIYVRPIVEKIKRRNFFQKTFFRSRAVVRVSRVLRGRHVKLFGRVSRHTGTPLRRMVTLIIQYVPKYLVFLRNMRGALMVRSLRLVHWWHNIYKKIWVKAKRGIYFRRISSIRRNEEESDESRGDDESDSEEDDDESSVNDVIGDDASEIGFREHPFRFYRAHSAPTTPIRRRRCYSADVNNNL